MTSLAESSPVRTAETWVQLQNAGLRYRILTQEQATLKGRVLDLFGSSRVAKSEFWALRNVNLELNHGEVVGLIGPNGSGKSTLLRLIARIIEPTEGTIRVQGRIGALLDISSTLNGDLTGRQNVHLFGALQRIPKPEIERMIPRIIEFAEIGPFFDVPMKTYSSGMAARVAFAMATMIQPDVLLVDEVLAVGDERFQQRSFFRMKKLIERGGLVVIVTHNMGFLDQFCSRVIQLEGGKLVDDGKPSSVIGAYLRKQRGAG
jgi:lipopolysaccharide transport system ATP-binding protein